MPPETPLGILASQHPFGPPIIKSINSEDALYVETILETIPLTTSMDLHATYSNKGPPANIKTSQGSFTASPGMVYPIASKAPAYKVNTGVLFVVPNPTMPNNAPSSHKLFVINTPFIPEEWHKLLLNIASFDDFSDLPNSICFGLIWGLPLPLPLLIHLQITIQLYITLPMCHLYPQQASQSLLHQSIFTFMTRIFNKTFLHFASWYHPESQFFD